MMWESPIGLVDIVGSPADVCLASGHSAAHMNSMRTVPDRAASRHPIPRNRATPRPNRPTMNSQSAQASPAQLLKVLSNGPTATLLKNPFVGDPPLIHARSDEVGVAPP